ncbi:MAG: heat-inducible transcriptional repressor HrcA [Thermovirgaceae bacterium]|nr:heat-inducible transcriptional repressor HrcA [Thermovirgaceae bacterium]
MLSERHLEVVLAIVYEYIKTGEPVGSRTISRKFLKDRSAATIRNEMSDLEVMEYLYQPHTSAGRIPTPKAYRLYVDAIMRRQRSFPADSDGWLRELRARRRDAEEALGYATRLLGKITNYIGVAALGPVGETILQRVEFIRMGHRTALILLVLKGGLIHHKTVVLPCDMTQENLDELSGRVSTVAVGRPWGDVRDTLQAYVEDALERYADNCRTAIREMDGILTEQPFQFFTGGTHNVLGMPDFNDLGRLQAIMGLLEEDESIGKLVQGCSAEKGLCITIGDENPVFQMRDCSIVMASATTGGRKAIVGLIGPVRMDYERSISVLEGILGTLSDNGESEEGGR